MPKIFLLPLAAALSLGAGAALAQDAPPPGAPTGHHWHMDAKDMAAHFHEMCTSHYAHAVGDMAYLETKLALSDDEKPAFDGWKKTVLGSAKSAEQDCLNHKVPTQRPNAVDIAKFGEHMLEMRLDGIKAQMPALETLYAKLSPEQDKIMDRAAMRLMHEHGGMHGPHDRDHGGMHGPMDGHGPMQGPGPDGPDGPDQNR